MKKLFIILIVLVVSVSLILGCAEPAPAPAPAPTPAPSPAPAPTPTPAPSPAPAPAPTPAPSPAPAPAPTPAPSPAPAPAPGEPQYGGILHTGSGGDPEQVWGDPLYMFGPAGMNAGIPLEKLLYVGDKPYTYQFELATGFKLAPDKSYYEINLRQGVKFHDGTDFNAQAVKWNLDRVLEAPRAEFEKVTSIDVIDDYTIRLNLSSWDNRILNDLTHDCCNIISPTAFEKNGADWAKFNPVGTGPFVFKELKPNRDLIFEKNQNYWDEGLPYLDGVHGHYLADVMTREAALLAGEVDALYDGCGLMAADLAGEPGLRSWLSDELALTLCMNTVDPESVWYDVRMRQALEYAIDKDKGAPLISPLVEPLYNVIAGLQNETQLTAVPRKYDPAKAKELMAAAGYPDGVKFTLYADTWHIESGGPAFFAWQAQWAEVGLIAEIEPIGLAKFAELSGAPMPGNSMGLQMLREHRKFPVEVVLESLSESTIYFQGVTRPAEWPSLLEQALQTEDTAEHLAILAEMDKVAYEEVMLLNLNTFPMVTLAHEYVHNLDFFMDRIAAKECWMSKE